MLTAYHLKKKGVSCVLVEGNELGSGITKNTTAKITAQYGLIYKDLIKQKGVETTAKYYAANTQTVCMLINGKTVIRSVCGRAARIWDAR